METILALFWYPQLSSHITTQLLTFRNIKFWLIIPNNKGMALKITKEHIYMFQWNLLQNKVRFEIEYDAKQFYWRWNYWWEFLFYTCIFFSWLYFTHVCDIIPQHKQTNTEKTSITQTLIWVMITILIILFLNICFRDSLVSESMERF